MSDVSEACERLRRLYDGESYRDVYGIEPTGGGLQQKDERSVIDACLAERDPTPIDAEWLRSVGFEENWTHRWDFRPWGPIGRCLSWIDPEWSPVWAGEVVYDGERMPHPIKTRGDVRRLCAALGITLKERGGE